MLQDVHLKYLSIRLDEGGKRVIGSFAPAGDTEIITLDDLNRAVAAAGFGGYRLDESALQDATAKYAAGAAFEAVIGEAVDGVFDIRIAADQLHAYLNCRPPRGGTPVTAERILEEAKRKGITAEIDLAAVANALNAGGDNILIASGSAAVGGADGRFESLIPSAKARSPHLDEYGLVDFRDLGEIPAVEIGDALMRRIPPTAGEPGLTLLGQIIPAKPGKDVAFAKRLIGSEFDPGDQNLLIASIAGSPVLLENGVTVEPIYTVGDVDLRTGNIDFPGTVNVTGDIHVGMTVKASGDIHVNGTVEGVTLVAGGDIVVKGGIVGLTERGKTVHASISCKGSCSAHFVQNAHISAGNGIFIRDFAMQSEMAAAHQIIVGDKGSRKGHIIGGVTRAVMLIKAQIIGSPARAKTIVIAGADQALHDRLTAIAATLDVAMTKLIQVVKLLELARTDPSRMPPAIVKAAEATRDTINAEMTALRLDEDQLKLEIAASEQAQVIAEKQFLEGVEISFGSSRHRVVADREGGVVQLEEGELVFA
jgi:uncharacterized protein (DUF342 family)